MKRIVPAALLALAALVVLSARTMSSVSPALARIPAAVNDDALDRSLTAVLQSRLDADAIRPFGRFGDEKPSIASAHPDELRSGAKARPPAEREADPALPGSPSRQGGLVGKQDGTTPEVAGLAAQGSTTPASARTIIALVTPAMRGGRKEPELRQVYAGLIEPAHLTREQECLAQAVYFEARSEAEEGRVAVAQVVLNRVKSGAYPTTVCGVVFQNRHRKLACQFTFACEGKALRITEPEAWKAALRIARDVYEGRTYIVEVGDATHYHADHVQPGWAKKLKKMDVIGRHIFYG